MKRLLFVLFLAFSCYSLEAQFSLTGEDPAKVRWKKMDSPSFRIIYPEGEDSLAIVYGSWLEKAKRSVSWSSGMEIGQYYKRRMPAVLHSFHPVANASVAWAPKRMDFYTVLDPYAPTPIPWERLLSIHEGRHAAQMQAGGGGRNRILHYLSGELFAGAVAGLYPGPTLLEGDAVVAETALTQSGRGRQASFLEYMVPALDSGDWRDYWRWSLGSAKLYTPDHYRAGYMLVSGMRVFFDDPLFTSEYFRRVRRLGFFLLRKTIKDASGMNLKRSYGAILDNYQKMWASEAEAKGPFMPATQMTGTPWRHVAYSGSVIDSEGRIWSKKGGMAEPTSLVIASKGGKDLRIRSFASYTSPLAYDKASDRIWWSESVMGVRWSLGGSARIRYINVSDPSKVYDLTTAGRYYNPAPSPDGTKVSATEYPYSGGSRLAVLSTKDGSIEKTMEVPDSLQITESAWVNDRIFVAGLSDHGMGVYELSDGGRVDVVLGPQPVELSDLKPAGPGLGFICDRTGTREMYLLDIQSGSLLQATSTRYGVSSPVFNNAADTLYYSSLAPSDNPEAYRQGWMIYSTPAKDLPMLPVSFDDIHSYKVADTMSAQEKELAGDSWEWAREYSKASFSEPRRHRKLTPTFHSWAPIYFDYDDVEGISLDEYYKTSSPGATAIFQNLVGDGYGSIGYGFHQDADLEDLWRHSAHLRFTYNGLPPVIEFSADIGDRAATDIVRVQQTNLKDNTVSIRNSGIRVSTRPYFNGSLRLYTPLNFSSGGVSRGLIPQLKYSLSNDRLNDKIILGISSGEDGDKKIKEVGSIGNERISYLSTVDLSVRGYVMRSQAPSQPYPRLGIGAEIGLRSRPGHSGFYSNMAYLYTYGYLPGLRPDQGLRLTATIGAKVGGGEFSYTDSPASFVPRGFADSNVRSILNRCSPMRYKLSADYVIRFLNIDWSGLSPLAYIKNFSLTPFADFAQMRFNTSDEFLINPENISSERLLSVGADLTVNLGNFFWLPFDSQVGIRYARNSWKNIEGLKVNGLDKDHFSFIFNVSL